jgi:phosphatidylglycerophosphate synthase
MNIRQEAVVLAFAIAIAFEIYEVWHKAPNNQIAIVALSMTVFIAVVSGAQYLWKEWRSKKT